MSFVLLLLDIRAISGRCGVQGRKKNIFFICVCNFSPLEFSSFHKVRDKVTLSTAEGPGDSQSTNA